MFQLHFTCISGICARNHGVTGTQTIPNKWLANNKCHKHQGPTFDGSIIPAKHICIGNLRGPTPPNAAGSGYP